MSVKFQVDTLNFCDFIQIYVFTTNHHLKRKLSSHDLSARSSSIPELRKEPGRVAQSVGHLTRKSEVLVSIPGVATS